jgi:diguanylate cyclase (GGDEF)-like protein/PAS domain S-box-containing protein
MLNLLKQGWFVLVLFFCSSSVFAQTETKPLIFGVYAYIDEVSVRAEYQPLIDYLNQQLGEGSVQMRILPMDKLNDAIRDHQIDIVTTNPTHYLQLRYQYPLSGVIATRMRDNNHQPMAMLGGVIFTKSDRNDINRLQDVVGKRIAFSNSHHLGGYWAQLYALHQQAIQLNPSQLVATGTHQNAVKAVLAGQADVGFVRTGVLERMQEQGRLSLDAVKVINAQYAPAFANNLSTELYPEWAVFALADADNDKVAAFTRALLSYHLSEAQAKDGDTLGYTIPVDYMKVEALARALRLPPFNQAPAFNLADVWAKWSTQGELAIVFGLLLLVSVALLVNLTRQVQAERYRAQLLLASLGEGVFGVDIDGYCTFVNQMALTILGYRESELLNQNHHQLLHHHHADGRPYRQEDCPVYQTIKDGQIRSGETYFVCANGRFLPVHYTVAPIKHGAEVVGAEVIFQDITERKETEKQLYQFAHFDSLTGCANRRYFMQQLDQVFQSHDTSGTMVLMMCDLDHFKQINDHYGHAAGDLVLQEFSKVLHDHLRAGDVAGRIGGEEFTMLLLNTDIHAATVWVEHLRQAVQGLKIPYQDQSITISVSIGVAIDQQQDASIDAWLSRADGLMYRAKMLGRNRVEVG